MAIVERIEIAEAGHEDKPSGRYARNKIEAEEQPFPIDVNVAVLLVPLAVQDEKKSKWQNDCGQKQNGPIAKHPQFLLEDGKQPESGDGIDRSARYGKNP